MIDFHNKFALVVNWSTMRLIIMMADIDRWESIQIDYVIDFSQAPIDSDVYLVMLLVNLDSKCRGGNLPPVLTPPKTKREGRNST